MDAETDASKAQLVEIGAKAPKRPTGNPGEATGRSHDGTMDANGQVAIFVVHMNFGWKFYVMDTLVFFFEFFVGLRGGELAWKNWNG